MWASEFWPKDSSFGTKQNSNILYPIELEHLLLKNKVFYPSYFITELLITCRNTAVNMQIVFFRGMIIYLDKEAPIFKGLCYSFMKIENNTVTICHLQQKAFHFKTSKPL
jgi:hypothetical protein